MKLFNFIKRKFSNLETKSSLPRDLLYTNGLNFNYNMSLYFAQFYYQSIAPLATGVDIIADEFQIIEPMIFDKEHKEFIEHKEFDSLLDHPNSDETQIEFLGSIIRYYLVNGNCFIVGTGNTNRPPLELYSINPIYMNIQKSTKDMFPDHYTYQSDNISAVFTKIEEKGRLRYINEDRGWELWHIRDFTMDNLWGLTRLNAIMLEIDQIFSANKHNLSILKKGIRSSGILTSESKLNQDQKNDIKAQMHSGQEGDINAGSVFLLDGGKMKFHELSKSLKDMDFKDLKKDMTISIFNRLKIPLPLISTDNQKFANYFEAKLGLYDNVEIPLAKKIFMELSLFLFPRFNIDQNRNKLWFNLFDIDVLRERHIKGTIDLYQKKVISLNESRKLIMFDDFRSGDGAGDKIYIPSTEMPMGSSPIVREEKSLKIKSYLKNIKYKNGENVYRIET